MIIFIHFYTWNNWDGNISEGYAVVTQHYVAMELPSNPVLRLAQSPVTGRHSAFLFLAWSKQWIIDAADDC